MKAARVIDLAEFRERRANRAQSTPAPMSATLLLPIPVWVVWIPIWT